MKLLYINGGLMQNNQPNLLFIYADQHRSDVMGCAGNDIVVTPNLDRLASEGVRFDQAWTESPICQPARASMLTGRYPSLTPRQVRIFSHEKMEDQNS